MAFAFFFFREKYRLFNENRGGVGYDIAYDTCVNIVAVIGFYSRYSELRRNFIYYTVQ